MSIMYKLIDPSVRPAAKQTPSGQNLRIVILSFILLFVQIFSRYSIFHNVIVFAKSLPLFSPVKSKSPFCDKAIQSK